MDYEKKYKKALEVAKKKLCLDEAGMVDTFTPNDIYEMFPELKEKKEPEKLTELELNLYDWLSSDTQGEFSSEMMKSIAKNRANILLDIARKQIASELDIKKLVEQYRLRLLPTDKRKSLYPISLNMLEMAVGTYAQAVKCCKDEIMLPTLKRETQSIPCAGQANMDLA